MGTVSESKRLTSILLALLLLLAAAEASAVGGFDPEGEGDGYPEKSKGRMNERPSIAAFKLGAEGIELDGRLDDAAWQSAEAGTNFIQADPERGSSPTEDTVFKVAYDDKAIYFGVACYENDPSLTKKSLSRRDRLNDSDVVSVYIDPYLDRTTGYNFRVNPLGVQMDQYVFNDGNMDRDWDAVWDAEAHSDADGWYVEMRIPFSSIRYREADSMTWGLQVYRWMQGRGEDDGWVVWDRETRGFVSRFGNLTGLTGVPAPRQLEVLPYIAARATDPSTPEPVGDDVENLNNYGVDLKYGVTADLTLNATLNPDFGQVEADPAILNLSPFETFYDEKRPFFIEGARFFEHPFFDVFYSRRIGFEDAFGLSRIRAAGKLTGKTASNISTAMLFATTDVATVEGDMNKFFKSGHSQTHYGVSRFGKEFADGQHKFNVMGTAVLRPGGGRADAYTGAADFEMNFHDRDYRFLGAWVGSLRDQGAFDANPAERTTGNAGRLMFQKLGGNVRGSVSARYFDDTVDYNDVGFLNRNNYYQANVWLQQRYNGDGKGGPFNRGQVNLNFYQSWLYAGDTRLDENTGETLWSYGGKHPENVGGNVNGWFQLRNFWSFYFGSEVGGQGSSFYETRGGPLMTDPGSWWSWFGLETDWRKKLTFEFDGNYGGDVRGRRNYRGTVGTRWTMSSVVNHSLRVGYRKEHYDAQHISPMEESLAAPSNSSNFDNPGGGIGGVSYVFGNLDAETFDITLRSNVLFSRDQSLELYVQPFLTVGKYTNPRELLTPDSYDLRAFSMGGFDAADSDFNFTSVNLNLVYRWQYRPGSTLYLVWTHSRATPQSRHGDGLEFKDQLHAGNLFNNEGANVFLAKLSYWFSL